ncbi:hypothetical protein Patl1_16853 [Pistacia atlantica]|uniref:Uncharacterized protein n=1 Tax=Pistacia atlantica TaxID=434234 RepID=A0ACC1B9E7_9ROSI|nr:hypothetical protein Patl1_16853 [Pistacia atlantica]
MQGAASFKLRHGREEDAFHLYEELVKTHGSIEALVGLVTTAAHVDTYGAKHVEGAAHVVPEVHEERRREKPKKRRKRKPRYPKGFDPGNPGPPPNPERWFPRRERSSYRPKRKHKRAAQVRGSQGAVVRDKHEAGASGTNSNASNSTSSQVSSSKGASQNAGQQSKASSKSSRKKSRN